MVVALRVLFFGTPAFAVPSLDALVTGGHTVVGVITQPDRPKGRGHQLTAPPVKVRALEHGLSVHQPDRLKTPETLEMIRGLNADLAVVAAYGRILPQVLLDIPRLGFINVHASLLPRWRGAAPIHRAVLAGDEETGITIMRVVLALDAGPMLSRIATPIGPDETSDGLEGRLATMGGDLLVQTIAALERGHVTETPQDESFVTYAAKIERKDGVLDWTRPTTVVHNQIRGVQPWPLAATAFGGTRVLIRRAENPRPAGGATPGTIVELRGEVATVACRDGVVDLIDVQPDGRRPMSAGAFLRGQRASVGDVFVTPPSA